MLKRIHTNRHHIAANKKNGDTKLPPWTVKTGNGKTFPCHKVEICGSVESVYRPEKPLNCGAVLWLETKGSVWVYTDEWIEL